MDKSPTLESVRKAARCLVEKVEDLTFSAPVAYVYNPLVYAWEGHAAYLQKAVSGPVKAIFLGMNPGPWGMAQTGVPFGEVPHVRDWLGVETNIGKPPLEHPKRPVVGFDCQKEEVSGKRLWGLFRDRFKSPENFFREHFVANYCPLVFMEETGRNRTPDKLPTGEQRKLLAACDEHLRRVVDALGARWVVGVGAYATQQAERALEGRKVSLGRILHPSPASPAANKDWKGTATRQLVDLGIWEGG